MLFLLLFKFTCSSTLLEISRSSCTYVKMGTPLYTTYALYCFTCTASCSPNSNRFTPHIHTPHSPPLISDPQPPLHHSTPAHSSAHTSSSSTRHTETFFTAPSPSTSSPVRPGGPLLPATSRSNPPPVPSPSESPWSFIQIVAKGRGSPCRGAELSDRVREEGRRGSVRQKSHHHHHHHRHMSHHGHHSPVSYWQRRQRRSHHNKYLTNPLAKVQYILEAEYLN